MTKLFRVEQKQNRSVWLSVLGGGGKLNRHMARHVRVEHRRVAHLAAGKGVIPPKVKANGGGICFKACIKRVRRRFVEGSKQRVR